MESVWKKRKIFLWSAIFFSFAVHGFCIFLLQFYTSKSPHEKQLTPEKESCFFRFLPEREPTCFSIPFEKNWAVEASVKKPLSEKVLEQKVVEETLTQKVLPKPEEFFLDFSQQPFLGVLVAENELIEDWNFKQSSLPCFESFKREFSLPVEKSESVESLKGAAQEFLQNEFLTVFFPPFTEDKKHVFSEKKDFGEKEAFLSLLRKNFESCEPPLEPGISFFSPCYARWPSLEKMNTLSLGDDFDVEVEWRKQNEGEYLFALTLIPKEKLKSAKCVQNYFFLLDKAHAMQGGRFYMTKHAVAFVLPFLEKEDRFNILAFDSQVEKVFPSAQNPDEKNIVSAKHFLTRQSLGNFFSSANLLLPLEQVLEEATIEEEFYTIFLLTNGEQSKNLEWLQEWTKKNKKKCSLFIVGMEEDENLSKLDLFSLLNGGKTFLSSTQRGLRRQLFKAMKGISRPIMKKVSVHAITLDRNEDVELNFLEQNPFLYLNQPYVILGKAKKLEDFVLFLQGRVGDRWFHMKKRISLAQGKEGERFLEEQWNTQLFSKYYEKYLSENDLDSFKKAKNFAKQKRLPYRFP